MKISKAEFIRAITSAPHMYLSVTHGGGFDIDTINGYLKCVNGTDLGIPRTVAAVRSEYISFSDGSNLLTHPRKTYFKYEIPESDHILLEVAWDRIHIYYDIRKEGDPA